ncbi:MAG: hypothetical protein G8D58_05780 [gamma proteobacterium symbiont of Phacoides pectinatus]
MLGISGGHKRNSIDDATCDLDLRSSPRNHFEKLRGNLAGKHSIRVNKHKCVATS